MKLPLCYPRPLTGLYLEYIVDREEMGDEYTLVVSHADLSGVIFDFPGAAFLVSDTDTEYEYRRYYWVYDQHGHRLHSEYEDSDYIHERSLDLSAPGATLAVSNGKIYLLPHPEWWSEEPW